MIMNRPLRSRAQRLRSIFDWFNHRRLLEPIGNVPPAELELAYCRQQEELAMAA